MSSILISMVVFILVASITPGPVNIIATSTGASFGFLRTVPHVAGASAAYCLICLLAGLGLAEVFIRYPQAGMALQYMGAAFLFYMTVRIALAPPLDAGAQTCGRPPHFIEGFLTQALNPKAWLAALSGISLYVAGQQPPMLYLAIFCILAFSVCFGSVAVWAGLGRMLQQMLTRPGISMIFNRCMAVMLAVTVLAMLMDE